MKNRILIILFFIFISGTFLLKPCTNILVSKGASSDGSVFISYAADSHVLYGELYHWKAKNYPEDAMLKVYEWDTGKYLGSIKQAKKTYNVVGNINENQVSIGETTFGGRKELRNSKGIVDYGSAMYIALQRSRTAREAIRIMTGLFDKYGYYSSGESFSVSDAKEVWILEVIGKGEGNKGANWVAMRVPDGYICAHANQSRIGTFPLNDPDNCLYSKDIIEFAREKGYFKGKNRDFSFRDAFDPPGFGGLRFCEARVWSVFRRAAPSLKLSIDYVKGVEGAEPMPLFIKPDKKLTISDMMELMRDHFEGTEFDMTKDIGAGPFKLPYRWRGLTWKVDGKRYFNERAISTQQTGFSFIAQSRSWLPDVIGGILWFGVDDTYSTCYFPVYGSSVEVSEYFAVGNGNFNKFSWKSAFWIFNFVSNLAYSRYSDIIEDIKIVQGEMETGFISDIASVDKRALKLLRNNKSDVAEFLTGFSVEAGNSVAKRWKKLGEEIFVKYLDGNVRNEDGKVTHPGYPKEWYRRIVKETGDRYRLKKMVDEIKREYEDRIKCGKEQLNELNLKGSLNCFKMALKLKPESKYPEKMIMIIKKLLAELKVKINRGSENR